MARSFTIPKLIDEDGLTVINAWCRAFRGDTHALVETQFSDSAGTVSFTALPDNIDCYIISMWGNNTKWFYSEAPPDLSELPGDLDDIADGGTYAKIEVAQLTANRITLSGTDGDLDDVSDGASYSKVLTTDITSGHILLSEVTQSSTYRTTTDSEKSTWNGKPDDMDDIGEGSTYQRVRATSISSGHIQLTSNTVVSGEWYDESGVEIDATHGINIYGTNNALTTRATKAGTIQCYVGSDGAIYAGAGSVILNAAGISIGAGEQKLVFLGDGSYKSYIYGYGTNNRDIRILPSNKVQIAGDVMMGTSYNIWPQTGSNSSLGDTSHYFLKLWVDDIALDNDIVPKTDVTSILGDASHIFHTGYIDKVFRSSAIASQIGTEGAPFAYGYFAFLFASGALTMPVKATTGDPATGEGKIYANTYDNKVRCYADGAWRDLATW